MEINDIRRSTFYIFIFFLTISEINNKARQNISCKTITELAVLSWTCNLWENLHTEEKNFMLMKKLKANHCMSWGLLQLHRHHIWRMDLTVAPKHFFGSAAQVLMHTQGSARTVLTDVILLHMLSESPQTFKIKDMWLIFLTNCLQGLWPSWVIRHVPALFHCFCCRVEMVLHYFWT